MAKDVEIRNMTWHTVTISWQVIEPDWFMRISFAYIKKKGLINWKIVEYKEISWCNEIIMPKEKWTIYIVSEITCKSLTHRWDIYMPHWIMIDKKWVTLWAKWIKVNPYYKESLDK